MTLSLPKVSRKNTVILTTFLIIIGVFAYYFLVYVQGNEKEITERAYRVLHRKALNIQNKSKGYEKYLGTVYDEVSPDLKKIFKNKNDEIKQLNALTERYYSQLEEYDYNPDTARKTDQAKRRLRENIDRAYKRLDNLYRELELDVSDNIKSILESAAPENVHVDFFQEGEVYYERKNYYLDQNTFTWFIEKNDKEEGLNSWVQFSESSGSFLRDILRNKFYQQFILLKDFDNYYGEGANKYSVAFQTFKNPIDLKSLKAIEDASAVFGSNQDSVSNVDDPKLVQPVKVSLYNTDYLLVFHQFNIKGKKYYLGGFLESEKFKKEAQKVEIFVLVLAILTVLLLIISMPLLKLIFMSSIERLYIKNVVMTGVSIIIGVPIILLIIFVIYTFVWRDGERMNNELVQISNQISGSFEKEVGDMLYTLNQMDARLDTTKLDLPNAVDTLADSTYRYYNHAFWVKRNGRPELVKTTLSFSSSNISLRERTYVKKVLKDSLWTFRYDTITYDCFLESIISWSDFSKETAISMPSRLENRGYPIAAITSQMGSVMHPILPPGYGFAVINPSGEVQYHSEKDRILQENFLEESNEPARLIAAVHSRVDDFAHIRYRNVNHQAYIKPINSLPLYLVVFYNKEYRNAKIQGVISISIILLLVSFGMASLMMLILYILQQKRSKLKIKSFLFHWIKPCKEKSAEYLSLAVLFIIVTILMSVLILFQESWGIREYDILFLFVITNAYLFMVAYSWLSDGKKDKRLHNRERNRFFGSFIFFLVVANLIFFYSVKDGGLEVLIHSWWVSLYQIILITIVLISNRYHQLLDFINERLSLDKIIFEKHGYSFYLFIWLFVSSVLPVLYIFRVSYNEETKIWQKYDQLAIAESYHQKIRILDNWVQAIEDDSLRNDYFNSRLTSAKYANIEKIERREDTLKCTFGKSVADQIFASIRPHYNKLIVKSKGFVYDGSHDCNYHWRYTTEKRKIAETDSSNVDFLVLHYRGSYDPVERRENGRTIVKSKLDQLEMATFSTFSGATFAVIILVVLVFIYVLIEYCANKIYALQYATFKNHLPLEIENFKQVASDKANEKLADRLHPHIILLGLPKSNKSKLLQSLGSSNKVIDLIDMNHEDDWGKIMKASYKKSKGIILENFEYGISSHDLNKKRRALLEKLIIEEVSQLVISTNVHPRAVIEFYEVGVAKKGIDDTSSYTLEIEVWRQLLGGFIVVHNPIKQIDTIDPELNEWVETDEYKNLFKQELNKGTFLPTLLPAVKDYFIKMKENVGDEQLVDKEDIILRIQLLAESYYQGLWNTLSKEEKYVIYDLAADRFVNSNNTTGIRNLLEKGLLVYDQELKIMNESFTNFVLMVIKKSEALRMEKEVREKGTWSTISTVLVLVLLGALAFLFLANPDFFQNLNALMSVLVGIFGLLTRFGSVFVSGKSSAQNGGE
ncbi:MULTISPECIES: hypothetical protein [unclassified Ekhidna]|uniref:hypothetical protein n=1 Tax=unclassified Ekhidna TaxID=2632188 RepID=UPI0032DF4DD6